MMPTLTWDVIDPVEIERNLSCGLSNVAFRMYDDMPSPICIVIAETNYTMFYPVVDEFTLLEIDQSFNESWLDDPKDVVYIRVEVGKKSSPWRRRSQINGGIRYTVPFLTLIIETVDGIVSKLYWDDSCGTCVSPSMCVGQSCGVAYDGCQSSYNCNLQIYVGWFGTDSRQDYMQSAGKRLSRFRGASLRGALNTALTATLNLAGNAKPIGS